MREIGVAMNITELGASEAMIPDLVKATFRLNGGCKQLTEEEVAERFRQSLQRQCPTRSSLRPKR